MTFTEIIQSYLDESRKHKICELELRFGRNPPKPIAAKRLTRIDYNNVIQRLLALGFTCNTMKGDDLLRINIQGYRNIRIELTGIDTIQRLCKTNQLPASRSFVMKEPITKLDVSEYRVNAALSEERPLDEKSPEAKAIISDWDKLRKAYRYINRVRLYKEGIPIYMDCSIVKMSSQSAGFKTEYTNTIQESNVFDNQEAYEIEIEVDWKNGTAKEIETHIKTYMKHVLGGLQQSLFPVSYVELESVKEEYLELVGVDRRSRQRQFIGPSQITLQLSNLQENTTEISVRENYTVTAKADGVRKLMYISSTGRIYFIRSNLSIEFTGAVTKVHELFNSVIDGEHIINDKHHQFINLYAMFDIYFINKKDIRSFEFYNVNSGEYRHEYMRNYHKNFKPESILSGKPLMVKFQIKEFYATSDTQSIFQVCNKVINSCPDYIYETDGLILTPTNYGVGQTPTKKVSDGARWEMNFKWKPPEFNTIDFLIEIEKVDGKDKITENYETGDMYKTLILKVGFNPKDGIMNPCQHMIDDTVPAVDTSGKSSYKAVQFFPSDGAGGQTCSILLKRDKNNEYQMFTDTNEVFHDNMVVEFRYDKRWIPLRIRWDKTIQLLESIPGSISYGNDYKTADSNWKSINYPIEQTMLMTGLGIPKFTDAYYLQSAVAKKRSPLQLFHNTFVKYTLISSVTKPGDTLMDFSIGKGGDINKWISSKTSFVFGLDVAREGVEGFYNSACSRYMEQKIKSVEPIFDAIFVVGDSSKNIRTGDAVEERHRNHTKAIFGEGDKSHLGKGILKHYGVGKHGFHVTSMQFALHYMFETSEKMHGFLRNVSECTRVGGYFIGTCYDGSRVFKLLQDKKMDDRIYFGEDTTICEITKLYAQTEFKADETSLGYKISVFQNTIGQHIDEYLVHFEYLIRLMENYGFVLIPEEEATTMGLSTGCAGFSELFRLMNHQIKTGVASANDFGSAPYMNSEEKRLSFLNNYFIFKKLRDVDAESVGRVQKEPVKAKKGKKITIA